MVESITEQKELELVEKVELRFALADTSSKLEKSIDTFLGPLLLKLASPHASVKQAVFNCLKDVLSRLNTMHDIQFPINKLIKQAQQPPADYQNNYGTVQLYTLLMVSKGIDRIDNPDEELVMKVIKGIAKLPKMAAARMFHILCKILLKWNPPQRGSMTEDEIRQIFQKVEVDDISFLSAMFTKFFLLVTAKPDPQTNVIPRGYTSPGLNSTDVSFFTYDAGVTFSKEQLIHFRKAILHFVSSTSLLGNNEMARFLLVASSDGSDISEIADQQLKRIHSPYEEKDYIDSLIQLFQGNKKTGTPPVKHELQESILSILNRSIAATSEYQHVSTICSIGLNSKHYKLRSLCLEFIRHVAMNNYQNLLPLKGEKNFEGFTTNIPSLIRNNLHSEGWPKLQLGSSTPNFNTSIIQRNSQYETLGAILKRDASLLSDLSYIEFLFDSLKGDLPEFRQTIQECLTSFTINLEKLPQTSKENLRKLIRKSLRDDFDLDHAESKEQKESIMSCRMVCIKYTNAVFPFDDPEARMFNIWGTSRTNRFDIIEESYKGLHPYWFRLNHETNFENFKSNKERLVSNKNALAFPSFEKFTQYLLKEIDENHTASNANIWKTLGAAVRFSKQSLISEAAMGEKTMVIQDEDWSVRVQSAPSLDERIIKALHEKVGKYEERWFLDYLRLLCDEFVLKNNHDQTVSRSKFYENEFGEVLLFLLKLCGDKSLLLLDDLILPLFRFLKLQKVTEDTNIYTATEALSIIAAGRNVSDSTMEILNSLTEYKQDNFQTPIVIANAYIVPRLSGLSNFDFDHCASSTSKILLNTLLSFLSSPQNKKLGIHLIGEVSKFNLLERIEDHLRYDFVCKAQAGIEKSLVNNAAATEAWGYLSMHSRDTFDIFLTKLFEAHVSKQIEYLFSAGESLSVIAGGWNSKFLYRQLDTKRYITDKAHKEVFSNRITFVLNRLLIACDSTKPSLRKASCIWLLSFIQYLGHCNEVSSKCREIHMKFMRFLSDFDEFVQDSSARGLSLVYEIGSPDFKEEMIKGLVKSFTDSENDKHISSGQIGADTQLFAENMLRTDDGSVQTYKDILNLSSEVGDPALVYKFMSLAKSSSLWSSKKGMAFGLGAIMSKSSLQALILKGDGSSERLISKLFRYRFDPSTKVAESMDGIWQILIDNPKVTIGIHFENIMDELLKGMSNKEWRVREASTMALLHLLQTQPQEKLKNYLISIWTIAFRIIDDIKESVREAGTKLTNALAKNLTNSIDSNKGANLEQSIPILNNILPFLLGTKGLDSDAEDVRNFALKTILNLVKNTGDTMKPFAVRLVYKFTLLFSSIEPQFMNYLSLNASKYNLDMDALDVHRQNGVTSSPLFEAIDSLIKKSDDTMVEEHVNSAIKAAKKSVGLPSKIAASAVFTLLVNRYSTSLTTFCGKLLKVCTNSFHDRNESVALAFSKSFGYIFRVSTIQKSVKYADMLCEMYFSSEELIEKKIVAAAIEAVLKQAPSQFESVATSFMPLLFIASNDVDKKVHDVFGKVWREASTSGSGSVRLYFDEIASLLEKNISSVNFSTRKACSKAVINLCENMSQPAAPAHIHLMFEITMKSLTGRSWDGKELLLDALQSIVAKFTDFIAQNPEIRESLTTLFITELGRKNKEYVRKAFIPYCNFVAIFPERNLVEKLMETFISLFQINDNPKIDLANDDRNLTKRIKHDSDINKISSTKNIELEESTNTILTLSATIFKEIKTPQGYSFELLKFILTQYSAIFDSTTVHYTWRTQVGICKAGCIVLASQAEPSGSRDFVKIISCWWKLTFARNSPKESIENVKLQTIKFGAVIIEKIPSLGNDIKADLRQLSDSQITPKMEIELKNIGLVP